MRRSTRRALGAALAVVVATAATTSAQHQREDTYDCFPAWAPNDGALGSWNALYDSISLRDSHHVWAEFVPVLVLAFAGPFSN
jgi:hypothetical protein